MFQADPRGILALVAVAMCWALAVVLYRVGTPGSAARMLAVLLIVEGVTLGSSGSVAYLSTMSADELYRLYPERVRSTLIVHAIGDCGMLALYPRFLAAALQTPLTRPFATTRMRVALAAFAVGLLGIAFASKGKWVWLLYVALTVLFAFALVASIQAWRTATGVTRSRARAFTLAFGIRDACWGFVYGAAVLEILSGTNEASGSVAPRFIVYTIGTLVSVPLIAYGILRSHLFDIDLRIRWTIKQSTLAATFVAIVYVISESADRIFSSELGNVAGLLAAAVVVFFLAPLQRFAERVASAAMPRTANTPEYAAFRKLQVYEAALDEALRGGDISPKERAVLNRLRDTLGISSTDAETMERELQARNGVRGS